jgi:short-subunit dehydrogenase
MLQSAGVRLENCMTRYAMITGASSGIGLALAEALARKGRSLILVARQRDLLESIAIELTQRFGVEVLFRACDLGEPLRLSGFLLELEEGERQIDLLVNCAAVRSYGPFLAQDWGHEQDLIELNILALTRLCHALGNAMAVQGGGQILNVASIAAFQPGPWMASYAASKAYVLHFSEGLREELKKSGVKVSVLCPGPTRSAQRVIPRLANSKRCLSPEEVALYTVRALDKNRAVIIPGRRNRWLAFSPRLGSRWLVRKIAGVINQAYCPR